METTVKRGEIYYADLSPVIGSEQGGVRPVLIVQNDTGNRHSPTVIAAAITSQMGKAKLPTHIELQAMRYGLPKESVILLEQVRTLDKQRLRQRMGQIDDIAGLDDCGVGCGIFLMRCILMAAEMRICTTEIRCDE